MLNPKTKLEGKLTKGARVRIYYYNDDKGQRVAEQIKILTPASPQRQLASRCSSFSSRRRQRPNEVR